eukprot:1159177-Pelagomonas_calceolata.AAC.15
MLHSSRGKPSSMQTMSSCTHTHTLAQAKDSNSQAGMLHSSRGQSNSEAAASAVAAAMRQSWWTLWVAALLLLSKVARMEWVCSSFVPAQEKEKARNPNSLMCELTSKLARAAETFYRQRSPFGKGASSMSKKVLRENQIHVLHKEVVLAHWVNVAVQEIGIDFVKLGEDNGSGVLPPDEHDAC